MIPSRGGPAPSIHVFAPGAQLRIPQLASLTQTPHAQRTHHDRYTRLRTDQAPPPHGEQTYPEIMSDIIIPGIGSLEPAPALDHLDLLAPPVIELHSRSRQARRRRADRGVRRARDNERGRQPRREEAPRRAQGEFLAAGTRGRGVGHGVRRHHAGGRTRLMAAPYRLGMLGRMELHRLGPAPIEALCDGRGPGCTPGRRDRRRPRSLRGDEAWAQQGSHRARKHSPAASSSAIVTPVQASFIAGTIQVRIPNINRA